MGTSEILGSITCNSVYAKRYILSEILFSCTQNYYFSKAGEVTPAAPGYKTALLNASTLPEHIFVSVSAGYLEQICAEPGWRPSGPPQFSFGASWLIIVSSMAPLAISMARPRPEHIQARSRLGPFRSQMASFGSERLTGIAREWAQTVCRN